MDEAAKKKRSSIARKVTRKTNELYNAMKLEAHVSEVHEKITSLKYTIEELGNSHDEYMDLVDPKDTGKIDSEDKWYANYDVKTNQAIKTARDYIAVVKIAIDDDKKSKHV